MRSSEVSRRSWIVLRTATVTREVWDETQDIQFTVRVIDRGREKPFIEQTFYGLTQAEAFSDRLKLESEYAPSPTDKEFNVEYIVLDVHCVSCGGELKPADTEMELFRLGFPVHREDLKPDCISKLTFDLKVKGVLPMGS